MTDHFPQREDGKSNTVNSDQNLINIKNRRTFHEIWDCETDRWTEYGQTAKHACQLHWPQGKPHNKLIDVLDVYLTNVSSLTPHPREGDLLLQFLQILQGIILFCT